MTVFVTVLLWAARAEEMVQSCAGTVIKIIRQMVLGTMLHWKGKQGELVNSFILIALC